VTNTREEQILATFAQVTGTLVDGYDIVEMLQNLVDSSRDLLEMSEAGILLRAGGGELDLVASTSENESLVELLLQSGADGPSLDSMRTNRPVTAGALHAVPLRLRDESIGTLTLVDRRPGELDANALTTAQTLADVATIGILHERALREHAIVVEQLENALKSRVAIEQAKGVVSHMLGLTIDQAFDVIRRYARSHRVGLSATAEQIVARTLMLRPEDLRDL